MLSVMKTLRCPASVWATGSPDPGSQQLQSSVCFWVPGDIVFSNVKFTLYGSFCCAFCVLNGSVFLIVRRSFKVIPSCIFLFLGSARSALSTPIAHQVANRALRKYSCHRFISFKSLKFSFQC